MLKEVGDRSARHTATVMISSAVFATAYISTYAVPALLAAGVAGGEADVLSLGKGFQLPRAADGKIHGKIEDPRAAVCRMSPSQLKQAANELR